MKTQVEEDTKKKARFKNKVNKYLSKTTPVKHPSKKRVGRREYLPNPKRQRVLNIRKGRWKVQNI